VELLAWGRPKVVLITLQVGGVSRWGTGFIAERGRVLTSAHVVRGAAAVTVWANGTPYRGRVAAVDAAHDLAALVLADASLELKPLDLAPDGRGRPGDAVVILASRVQFAPGPRGTRWARGVRVWPVEGSAWDYAWLQWADGPSDVGLRLLARAQPGDSGSPVLRLRDGAVVGILRGRMYPDGAGRSETAWAVPIEDARALLARSREPLPGAPAPRERYYLESLAGEEGRGTR
jgi:S1-C subfamily serine protease